MKTFLKNNDWKKHEKKLCRVLKFTPMAKGPTPYASVSIDCEGETMTGFITHKEDFKNLKTAVDNKTSEQEVVIIWTSDYKNLIYNLISWALPKLQVMTCKKGAFKLMIDQNYKPELKGEARFFEQKPVTWIKPECME